MVLTINPNLVLSICFFISVINFLAIMLIQQRSQKIAARLDRQSEKFIPIIRNLEAERQQIDAILKRNEYFASEIEKINKNHTYLQNSVSAPSAYKQALKMVSMGADTEEVMTSCDLGRAEAELLTNLQGYRKVAS